MMINEHDKDNYDENALMKLNRQLLADSCAVSP